MQIYRNSASLQGVISTVQDTELHQLMSAHIERLQECEGTDLDLLIHFIVFEQGDTIVDLDAALGFSVMTNHCDGIAFGHPDFQPSWEFVQRHMLWFECVYVLGDDGAGIVVFVPADTDSELLPMFQHYAFR
jgi:hypothetical protein